MVRAVMYVPDSTSINIPENSQTTEVSSSTTHSLVPSEKPARIIIPSLNIDASIQHVGVNAKGSMASPNNFSDVGWYKYGTTPGDVGSAVIAGHLDNGLGIGGVFKDLERLTPNDDIYIVTESGARLHFVVSHIQEYPYTEVPLEVVFNQKDMERLNLITCTGIWISKEKTYDKRLIVFTELREW